MSTPTRAKAVKTQAVHVAAVAAAAFLVMPGLVMAQAPPTPPRVAQTPRPKSPPQPAAPRPAPVQPPAAPAPTAQNPASPVPTTQGAGTQGAAKASRDDVIGRVGNSDVTADDIRAYIATLGGREQAALAQDPALLSQAVRLLLANRLVLQELVAKKWDQQPDVEAQLQRVRESALVELYLQSVSAPPASFPSEEDVQKTYDANRSAFLMPRQFQLAQIFIAAKETDKAAEDQAKKRLDDVQRKLKAPGADFAAIARSDGEAKDGGELGWVAENQIRPEIRAQIMGLAKSAVSDPVRLDDGWHILKLVDTKASYTRTLPEVRDQLVPQMRAERAAMLRRAYLGELLKQHPPVLNELALSNLLDNSRK